MTAHRILVVSAAAACFAASCAAATSSSLPPPAEVPSSTSPAPPLPVGTRALPATEGRALSAGTFIKEDFQPNPVFRLGRGWHMGHDIAGFFDVQQRPNTPDVIAIQFARVYSAGTSAGAVRQLHRIKNLTVTDRGSTSIAGLPASEVQIDSRNPHLTPAKYTGIFTVAAGQLYIGSGRRLLVDFIQRQGALVAVLVGGSVRNWAATMHAAQPVLRSIRFV